MIHKTGFVSACAAVGLAGILLPASATAQPVVLSASETTGTLVITGTRFGSHAGYGGGQPFLSAGWHDFENNSFSGGNLELESDFSNQWSLQTSSNRTNSRYHAQKVFINSRLGEYGLYERSGYMRSTTGKFFVSFWVQLTGTNSEGKIFRIYGSSSDIFIATGGTDMYVRAFSSCGNCSPAPTTVWGTPNTFRPNTWHRVDVQMRDNSSGGGDYLAVYLDGVRQWQRGSSLPSVHNPLEGSSSNEREQWVPAFFGGDGHSVGVGQMLEGSGSYRFDDVYVDYTWARVELGNAPTWAACTVKEIQIPTAWSDTQVSVRLNRGAFNTGQTAYLYLVDANGSVNLTGYPVTVGGGGTTVRTPASPYDVRIIR